MKLSSKLFALGIFAPTAAAFMMAGPNSATSALRSAVGTTEGNMVTAFERGDFDDIEAADLALAQNMDAVFDSPPVTVQGGALKTWSFPNPNIERVLVTMRTEGYPPEGRKCQASVTLCQGPDNTPQRMEIMSGKGMLRPIKILIETPGEHSSVFIRNTGEIEFPISACVGAEVGDEMGSGLTSQVYNMGASEELLQGGAIRTWGFGAEVKSVKVVLKTDGRPLNAKVELIQGPNAGKVTIDLYTEDGMERPFLTLIESPGSGNSLRIVNTGTVEFPLTAAVEPFTFTDISPPAVTASNQPLAKPLFL